MMNQPGSNPSFYENNTQWYSGNITAEPLHIYTAKTFGWMFLGLLATFATGFIFAVSGGVYSLLRMGLPIVFVLAIAEIGVVTYLSARLHKLSINAARGLFFAYAILNGITFSTIFLAFDLSFLMIVFGISALYFGVLAAYGWLTKRDLSGLRPLLTGGLIFMAVYWLLSIFLPMSGFDRIVCFIGLALFMGYTAFDMQNIKRMHMQYHGNYEMSKKTSIIGALQLYLDFINIFLYILRILQRSNDN